MYPRYAQQSLSLSEGRIPVECCTGIVLGRFEVPAEVIVCEA